MGVTFWGNFASRTLLVPFHWRGMCYAHQFSREGSLCVRILGRPSQALKGTRNNAGTTRTCRATAARLSRSPVLSSAGVFFRGGGLASFWTELGKAIGKVPAAEEKFRDGPAGLVSTAPECFLP